jgi:hypothetical protein
MNAQDYIVLGQEEGDGELISPGQAQEGPDGNIYVADSRDYYIKVFSPQGQFLRRIGGRGEGPGEIKRMGRFGFTTDGKHLFFTEFFNGHPWISLIKLSGQFHRVIKINHTKRYGALQAVQLSNGRFLLEVSYMNVSKRFKSYFLQAFPHAILLLDESGNVIREIISRTHYHRISPEPSGADGPIWFYPRFIWTLADNRLLFSDGLSKNLTTYNWQGKKSGMVPTPLPDPDPVSDQDFADAKKKQIERLQYRPKDTWYQRYMKVLREYREPFYKLKTNLSGMSTTPAGNILLEGPFERNQRSSYWLINKEGRQLAHYKSRASNIKISKKYILFYRQDEEEDYVICFLNRRGGEIEDLNRLRKIQ